MTCVGHDGRPIYTWPNYFVFKVVEPRRKGCSFKAYQHYFGNTGTVHTFYHDNGSTDMPENDNFAVLGLANTISSWKCKCATKFLDISKL